MSDLANNIHGEHFTLPATAAHWRVRRLREGRGAPEVVFGSDGVPLLVPVEIDFDAFRAAVDDQPGRYRLDALDEARRPIDGIPAAYVAVPTRAARAAADAPPAVTSPAVKPEAAAPSAPAGAAPLVPSSVQDALLVQVIDANTRMFALMTERFSGVMESAAVLIAAVDSAGVSRRPAPPAPPPAPAPTVPPAPTSDGDGSYGPRNAGWCAPAELEPDAWAEDEPALDEGPAATGPAAAMQAVTNVVGEVMPLVKMFLAHKMASARPQAPRNAAPTPIAPIAVEPDSDPLSLAELRHLDVIDASLTPSESRRAQIVADDLSPLDRRAWFHTLCSLDVDDAVALIRHHIARAQGRPSARHRSATSTAPRAPASTPTADTHHHDQEDTDQTTEHDDMPRSREPFLSHPAFLDDQPTHHAHHDHGHLADDPDEASDDDAADDDLADTSFVPNDVTAVADDRAAEDTDGNPRPCGHDADVCPCEAACPQCGYAPADCACLSAPLAITPAMLAHAMSVQAALTTDESARILALAADMPDHERDAWMAELSTFSVADAVLAVRDALAALEGPSSPAPLPSLPASVPTSAPATDQPLAFATPESP